MGEYFLTVCYKRGKDPEAEKELYNIALHSPNITDKLFDVDEFEVLWRKGLKHMATILATAYDLKFSKRNGIKDVYEQLRRKVKVWIRSGNPWGFSNYIVPRAFWPCEVLDLREVQDEIKMLASKPLLFMENPEDRKLVEQATKPSSGKPVEKVIDRNIDLLNTNARLEGHFLTRITEFHRKYPEMRFWFFVEFD